MSNLSSQVDNPLFNNALDYAFSTLEGNMQVLQDFPESCTGPEWTTIVKNRVPSNWVNGFWVGQLWLAYGHTNDERFADAARQWSDKLAWLKDSVGTHDLGFIFYLSHVIGARLTGDEKLYTSALQAASTLIKRYNSRGEYLQAWGTPLPTGTRKDRGRINIDIMMNLELLYWATEYSGDTRYADVANQHARTSRLTLVRADGSIAQVGDFDPDSGLFIHEETHQGFSFDGCWSRGHAWGQYGFATAYLYTGFDSFLETSRKNAQYLEKNLPADLVPFWDYDSPDIPDTYKDSSASAVYACGLLELANCESRIGNQSAAEHLQKLASTMTESLWQNYSAKDTPMPTLLKEGARSVPHNYMEQALIYGDYYFLEALTKLTRPELAMKAFPEKHLTYKTT